MDISETLKIIRLNKGLTQKEFVKGIISPSFYSKVESGENKISATYLFELLDKLDVSLNEFNFIFRNYKGEEIETIFRQIKTAYYTEDSLRLRDIYDTIKKRDDNPLLLCLVNNLIFHVEEKEMNTEQLAYIKSSLFDTPSWGHYEFNLFSLATNILSLGTSTSLAIHIIRNIDKYAEYPGYTQDLVISLNNLTRVSLLANNMAQAQYYLALADDLNSRSFFLNEKLLSKLYRGLINIKMNDAANGKTIVDEVLDVYSFLDLKMNEQVVRKIIHNILY